MATKTIPYDDYKCMANNISYWLIKNNVKIKTRKQYSIGGKKISLKDIKKRILKSKNTNDPAGRKFLEAALVDNTNHDLFPTYVTWKKVKYPKANYEYMAKWVIAYWKDKKHTSRPKTVPVSKPKPKPGRKKYGHATSHGCDNMGQNNGYYCGVHSLQEIIRNLTGKVIKQSTLAGWAGTTTAGTDHYGLETALAKAGKQLGVTFKAKWYNFSDLGWKGIKKILTSTNQDCLIHNLYRDKWGHYEVVNSVSDYIRVQNSLGSVCSGNCYCGYVENRIPGEFRRYISGISQKSVLVVTVS